MIVGTAGHIDHGKTTLVRALTGVDTDRLPEEKRRGISIELGYAFLDTPSGRVAFVDVPGHERLVATMLSGASGIDHALLLVAADDGVMPQTREHLAALALLGTREATIVVTKVDRADPARVAAVMRDAEALVAGTPLAGAPVLAVSAATGEGLAPLRAALLAAAAAHAERERVEQEHARRGFRLAIDRVFALAGIGTVVTGTAHAGRVETGAPLACAPWPAGRPPEGRARSLHAQGAATAAADAGRRVAVNVAGLGREQIARGGWLVDPAVALHTDRIDATLTVWRDEAKALRSGSVVHVHLGTSDTLATVAVLDADAAALAPGANGRVQLVLRAPVAAWRGDRIVLRDASAQRVVAGGRVLDPFAPARHRRSVERLAVLDAVREPTPEARLAALVDLAPGGVDLDAFRRAEGLLAVPALPADAVVGHGHALGAGHARTWLERIGQALAAMHAAAADELGPDPARLRRRVSPRLAEAAWQALVERAVAEGRVARAHGRLHLPAHAVRLSAVEQRVAEKALPRLADGGFDPPWLRTLAADLREPEPQLRAALLRLARRGELHQVVKDLFYPPATMDRAAAIARALAARDGAVTAAAFRDATGLGRKRAIQIVEYFDRAGLLRRVGDAHRLRDDCPLFGGDPRAADVRAAA